MPTRRGSFATTAAGERFHLRRMLVGRIGDDPDFATALEDLYEAYVPTMSELPHWLELSEVAPAEEVAGTESPPFAGEPGVVSYVGAVRALANRWGLDRLIDRRTEYGARLIHDWCRARRTAGRDAPARHLSHGLTETEYRAEIGEVVGRTVFDRGDVRIVDELVRPVVHLGTGEWDPERMSRRDARKKLRALADRNIRAELDRITADAEAKGYRFIVHRQNLHRDLDWLFALMAKGETIEDLAARSGRDEATVARAVSRIAEQVGVSGDGWRLTHR